jgi:hypothetical protein
MVYHDASREGVISCWLRGGGTATAPVDHPATVLRHRDDRRNDPTSPWLGNNPASSPCRRVDPAEASSPSAPVPLPDVVTLNARQHTLSRTARRRDIRDLAHSKPTAIGAPAARRSDPTRAHSAPRSRPPQRGQVPGPPLLRPALLRPPGCSETFCLRTHERRLAVTVAAAGIVHRGAQLGREGR